MASTSEITTKDGVWPAYGRNIKEARARVQRMDKQTRMLVQDYPLATLAGAVLAGYILARLAARY